MIGNNNGEVISLKYFLLRKLLNFCIIITLVLILFGCNQKSQKPSATDEKPPESLLRVEKSIESIIDSLDKEGKIEEADKPQQGQEASANNQQGNSNQKSNQAEGGGNPNQEGSQQGTQQGSQQGTQQGGQQQQNPWEQADKTIKEIHNQWNEFQPQAAKIGISKDLIDSFGSDLNTLTNDIAVKNLMSTLNNANNLYKYIPDFLSHYKDKSADMKRLKYHARDAMYKSRFDKWDLATSATENAKAVLPNIRSQVKDDMKQNNQSMEYAVYDLEKVVKERQKSLAQIKGNIVLNNIKTLDEAIKKESEKESDKKSESK